MQIGYDPLTPTGRRKRTRRDNRMQMSAKWYRRGVILTLLCFLTGSCLCLHAQTSSGVITGAAMDSSGLAVAGAEVTLTGELTGVVWKGVTDTTGGFVFSSIPPGQYAIAVSSSGFKTYRKTGLLLSASERLSIGSAKLEIGAVTDSVTVTAEAAPVQTASQERSALLNDKQMAQLMVRGRDFINLLKVLPGVATPGSGNDSLNSSPTPTIQGIRSEYNTLSIDGVASNMGANSYNAVPLNMDAIAEVKVLLGNYQAEYGRNSGAVINAVTKSGTQQFHGAGYYYKRHEMFNATNFFNNRQSTGKPRYRYNTMGFNIGGPIYWPGKLNSKKDKLFFFFSEEYTPVKSPVGPSYYTVPTALERAGDFSATTDVSGTIIPVKDPTTGAAFPGNVIPASRINSDLQKLLNVFPSPNFTNIDVSKRNYNYVLTATGNSPARQELLRLDYNATDKLRMYFRGMTFFSDNASVTAPGLSMPWLGVPCHYKVTSPQLNYGFTYTISPTLVNEFTFGLSHNTESNFLSNESDWNKLTKSALGISLSQLNPSNNPSNVIPAASYGGITNAASTGFNGRFPMSNYANGWTFSDGLAKVWMSHTFKIGVYTERYSNMQRHHTGGPAPSGTFSFAKDVNNPNDANYAYANALLGNFATYSEVSNLVNYAPHDSILEWYAQDSWKVSKRLTIEVGVRFTHAPPYTWTKDKASTLALERYSLSAAPSLYVSVKNAAGARVAMDPLTGTFYPAVYIGKIVPGSGNTANGAVLASDTTYPRGFQNLPTMAAAPRFGFSYDPFGTGKTAIRGGFGLYNNSRPRGGQAGDMSFNPPIIYTPTMYYGNVGTFLGATGVAGPSSWNRAIQKDADYVQSYNIHFGVQRHVGFQTVVDVAYSATLGRHLGQQRDLNKVPYGAQFLAKNQDPTTGTPLADDFFRPYPGYGAIPYMTFDSNSSYHSLQTQVNRRFSKGLQFGAAWTWSKAMDYTDDYNGTVATYLPLRIWNYGKAGFDQTHVLTANWLWDIPKGSRVWNHSIARWVFDNWQLSGIATFASGTPLGIGFSTTDGANITGGGDGARVVLTGNAVLPKSQRSFTRFFDSSVFARPATGTIGCAPKDVLRGPGYNNWDLTLFKNFSIRDRASLQLRWEAYNAFNHTQWAGVNTTASFNAAGAQVNSQFGQVTSARDPRIMQLGLRFMF